VAGSMTGRTIPAPGAMTSPQAPGMVPDRTTVPGRVDEPTPVATRKIRPLTQYGTAEELARVFTRKPINELEPADFEQADASLEELRKADPAALTVIRPAGALGQASAAAEETSELGSGDRSPT
jgi:hypothetical protein